MKPGALSLRHYDKGTVTVGETVKLMYGGVPSLSPVASYHHIDFGQWTFPDCAPLGQMLLKPVVTCGILAPYSKLTKIGTP